MLGGVGQVVDEDVGRPAVEIEARYTDLQDAYLDGLKTVLGVPNPKRRVLPGVRPLLDVLAARPDVFLGLVTGNIEEGARVKLDAFGLEKFKLTLKELEDEREAVKDLLK